MEVALTACPDDLLQGESRQNVIFEVLQDLLIKVCFLSKFLGVSERYLTE